MVVLSKNAWDWHQENMLVYPRKVGISLRKVGWLIQKNHMGSLSHYVPMGYFHEIPLLLVQSPWHMEHMRS